MELTQNRLSETTLPDFVVLCIYDSRVKASANRIDRGNLSGINTPASVFP